MYVKICEAVSESSCLLLLCCGFSARGYTLGVKSITLPTTSNDRLHHACLEGCAGGNDAVNRKSRPVKLTVGTKPCRTVVYRSKFF